MLAVASQDVAQAEASLDEWKGQRAEQVVQSQAAQRKALFSARKKARSKAKKAAKARKKKRK